MMAGHSMYMTPAKAAELDKLPQYYCSLNFVMKNSALVKKVRPTSNFSAPHPSGSFNLLAVNGPSILNSAKKVLLKFFQYSTAITADILTAYRALHISELSQSLSRFFWVSNPNDPNTMTECCWLRATYGSAPTSIFMEIALREQIGGATVDEEVKELLNDSRFVDDLCASDHNPTRLVANMKSYIDICSKFGFTHGEVSSTNNIYEGTEQNQVRTLLGIEWNPALDVWRPNSEWNVSAKTRGIYKDRSVKEMSNDDLENLEVTKTLLSRLLGKTSIQADLKME